MKKTILFILCSIAFSASAQYGSMEITGGYTPDGYQGNVSYNLSDNDNYFKVGVTYSNATSETAQGYKIPYSFFSLNGGYMYSLYVTNRQSFKVAAGGGALIGYEVVNNGIQELEDGALVISENRFVYGGFASLETEMAISRTFYIMAKGDIYYHQNSDLGNITFYSGLGFRLYF